MFLPYVYILTNRNTKEVHTSVRTLSPQEIENRKKGFQRLVPQQVGTKAKLILCLLPTPKKVLQNFQLWQKVGNENITKTGPGLGFTQTQIPPNASIW